MADANARIDDAARNAGRDPREIRRLLNVLGEQQDPEQLADWALEHGFSTFIPGSDNPAELAATVVEPGDHAYARVRSTYVRPGAPGLVLRPGTPDEVAAALAYAREQDVELAVRSGSHGISGRSTNDARALPGDPARRRRPPRRRPPAADPLGPDRPHHPADGAILGRGPAQRRAGARPAALGRRGGRRRRSAGHRQRAPHADGVAGRGERGRDADRRLLGRRGAPAPARSVPELRDRPGPGAAGRRVPGADALAPARAEALYDPDNVFDRNFAIPPAQPVG
jgi:hypothetical protein